jgi:hypothetical protein
MLPIQFGLTLPKVLAYCISITAICSTTDVPTLLCKVKYQHQKKKKTRILNSAFLQLGIFLHAK